MSAIICSRPECQTTAGCQCNALAAAERIHAAASRSMAKMLAHIAVLEAALLDARGHFNAIRKAFGAPGDYGYGTPQGQSLYEAYNFAAEIGPKVYSREHNEMPERAYG